MFNIRNMHEGEKEREREKEGPLLLNPLASRSLVQCGPMLVLYVSYLSSGPISLFTMLGPGSALSIEERLTGDS